MSTMEPSTTSPPSVSEPPSTDAGDAFFKTPNAPPGRHFKQVITPGLLKSPIVPEWLSRRFRRKDTPVSR